MISTSISTRMHLFQVRAKNLSYIKLFVLLFAGSFLLHLIVAGIFINQPIALDDMFQYDMLAKSIKEGNGFRWYSKADMEILYPYYSQFLDLDQLVFPEEGLKTAFRAPGYPFLLAFVYLFTSEASRLILARVMNALIAASLAPLVALIAYHAGLSRKSIILAAIGISFYPILLFYPIGLASENLYIPLGVLLIFLVMQCGERTGWRWIIAAGVCCGATMLTRSIFAAFALFAAVWIGNFSIYKKRAAFAFLLIAFGLCLPWSIRNSGLMRKPAFVENSAGYNLFIGYHPEGDGGFVSEIAILPMNILDDGERDAFCVNQAISFIREDPLEALRRVFIRWIKFIGPEDREFFYFYSNNLVGKISPPWLILIYSLLVIPWGGTLLFGLFGLSQIENRKIVLLIMLFMIGYAFPHLLFLGEPRFHLAYIPILIAFAAFGWEKRSGMFSKNIVHRVTLRFLVILMLIVASFAIGFLLNFPKFLSIIGESGNRLYFPY